jgi:integrase
MTATQATPLPTSPQISARKPHTFQRHDDLLDEPVPGRDRDRWAISSVLDLLPALPNWPDKKQFGHRARISEGARAILEWLHRHPGEGWQDRWIASGADQGLGWVDTLITTDDPRSPVTQRTSLMSGLTSILLCRIVMPSYQFLSSYKAYALFTYTRQVFRPDLFAMIEERGHQLNAGGQRLGLALTAISKIVLHTGRDLDHLTAEDLLTFRAYNLRYRDKLDPGLSLAWALLREVTNLGPHATLKTAVRYGQRPTTELVDTYNIQSKPIREVLIRYLDERRASLDYSSLTTLAGNLVGRFWSDLERHHPGIDTLDLPQDVVEAWKQRIKTVVMPDGSTRPRRDRLHILITIRGFYRDLQEWALQDPATWARWAVRNPIRKSDTAGQMKAKKKTTAAMHQRTRERLPHLNVLVDTAERHKTEQATLLAALKATPIGQTFTHAGREYRRVVPKAYSRTYYRDQAPPDQIVDLATGEVIDVGKTEHEAFMAWAAIEVLRHTGVRIEELLEITHLALVSYKLPDTGETVPMLQIVPSKANEERLLLVSPELASVLATLITRLRSQNGGTIPLTSRYDQHEHVTGPPLPHLFQHRLGWTWEAPTPGTIQKWLAVVLTRTALADAAGQPLHYTPHDFRRMFATEAVGSGLPVHIVARLLGHTNINTTQAYMAVFDEQLVRSYRTFLDNRRAQRPEAEYREPTEDEWQEFQQHFQLRKLELGECSRPYGTPCKHEHACIRCPSLRLDLTARPRLVEIIANLRDRIQEAKLNGWLGEVAGLEASLNEASRKLVSLNRTRERQPAGPVNLGIPVITEPSQ